MEMTGLGKCIAPGCYRPITEGEPIGVITFPAGPAVVHARCKSEYEEKQRMAKYVRQQGSGAVDFTQAVDMIQNPTAIPEYKSGKKEEALPAAPVQQHAVQVPPRIDLPFQLLKIARYAIEESADFQGRELALSHVRYALDVVSTAREGEK